MTTHLSVRLAWHDRGRDGRVCDAPHLNAHCIVHQHIRDSRDDEKERAAAGTPFAELNGWLPLCSRDPAANAARGFVIVHHDPLEFRKLPAASEEIPPYSSCPAPYRWMREEFFQEVCEAEDLSIRDPGARACRERARRRHRTKPAADRRGARLEPTTQAMEESLMDHVPFYKTRMGEHFY